MTAVAVLSARYIFKKLKDIFPTLPPNTEDVTRWHEFIITIGQESFERLEKAGLKPREAMYYSEIEVKKKGKK